MENPLIKELEQFKENVEKLEELISKLKFVMKEISQVLKLKPEDKDESF